MKYKRPLLLALLLGVGLALFATKSLDEELATLDPQGEGDEAAAASNPARTDLVEVTDDLGLRPDGTSASDAATPLAEPSSVVLLTYPHDELVWIEGIVIAPNGSPAAGAVLEVQYRERGDFRMWDQARGSELAVLGRGQTNSDGRFRLSVPAQRALLLLCSSPGVGV